MVITVTALFSAGLESTNLQLQIKIMESTKVETNENPTLNKAYVMLQLPDGILWKKAAEYAKQFAIKDKPVESSKLMSDAQDHYYRGLIECRRLLSVNLT